MITSIFWIIPLASVLALAFALVLLQANDERE